jgi:5-hydroxyisourate hydrolase
MAGKLSTHVLDTANGRPAKGVAIELFRHEATGRVRVATAITNADGRTDAPLLEGDAFLAGRYELVFQVGDYFASIGVADARQFLDEIPIVFMITNREAKYHVPLLVSPWAYSTYRGS